MRDRFLDDFPFFLPYLVVLDIWRCDNRLMTLDNAEWFIDFLMGQPTTVENILSGIESKWLVSPPFHRLVNNHCLQNALFRSIHGGWELEAYFERHTIFGWSREKGQTDAIRYD
jgi:hypothetical protein